MDLSEFRKHAHAAVDWMVDYLDRVEHVRVKPDIQPRAILNQLPALPPEAAEPFETIFRDFERVIVPGMTHWQHPSFFAYFPANNSAPSILGEMLTAALGAQCMSWATSPAATELEERMMEWLRSMTGLPEQMTGVIQDTASTATLCSLLTAREVRSAFRINQHGFSPESRFTVYCSEEAHSSIEKAVKIAGIGSDYLRKIPVDKAYAMRPELLEQAIASDTAAGLVPLCVVAAVGTTGSAAVDPLRPIGAVCKRYTVWLHVDAAFAGTALLLPEFRWMTDGVEYADTFVFNPHKWMFTNFDCSAYFVRDKSALIRTFEILPEYLKTPEAERVNNYRDWGIQLGRRFRALKLWFVIRSFGVQGLQAKIRSHIAMAQGLAARMADEGDFDLLAPAPLNVLCFRHHPSGMDDEEVLNRHNASLLEALNRTGRLFLTHTRLSGRFTLRLVISQTNVQQAHVDQAWSTIRDTARSLRR